MAVSPEFKEYVAMGLDNDKRDLFAFADCFLNLAPKRDWAAWFVSAPRGYYSSHFLRTVYQLSSETPDLAPPLVGLAVGDVAHYPFHQMAVGEHVQAKGLPLEGRNVLLVAGSVTSEVQFSYPQVTLGALGGVAEVDIAYWSVNYRLRRNLGFHDVSNGVYPWMAQQDVLATTAQRCEFGVAEPLIAEGMGLGAREYIKDALSSLAHSYVHARESSSI
jgi:hypothetical protein